MEQRNPDQSELMERVYRENLELLLYIAGRWYCVPRSEAKDLAHDVFVTYMKRWRVVRDTRRWLLGAIIHRCQAWWKDQKRTEQLPPEIEQWVFPGSLRMVERVNNVLTVQRVLPEISPRCRQLFAFRYVEGETLAEIAKKIGTTAKYVKKLINGCMKKFRHAYFELLGVAG